ncbi:MAG TPA: GGDEF domain-containing protein, partial [Gemmatimonadaceae bacterium]|nr:GGDEF domain-containing protein [Gemmatimonadaceae bacterium]
ERQLRDLSMRDPLTGCFNRRYLHDVAVRLEERGETRWGCIHLELDRFREYNDRHGHAAGDELLLRMSRFLMRQVRAEEAVVRLGGDEFLVVLAGADDARTESVARRLQLAALRTAPARFSLGWAARLPGEPFERTVNRASQQALDVQVIERSLEWQRREEE